MADPKILDFSAEEEDVVTIIFPDGKSCELPTMEELTMPSFQFIASNGEEWYELFEKTDLSADDHKRFDHLNNQLAYALCEVPRASVDLLSARQKAKIIVGFMTASPQLLALAQQMAEADQKPKPKPRTKKKTTAR